MVYANLVQGWDAYPVGFDCVRLGAPIEQAQRPRSNANNAIGPSIYLAGKRVTCRTSSNTPKDKPKHSIFSCRGQCSLLDRVLRSLMQTQFQGGAFDPYGGWGFEQCSILVNHEFERVFYKNNFASGVTIFNIYMVRTAIIIQDE